jgi:hypothetical protein
MSTTYVLGAGASRDAGYPFAADMGQGLLKWMEQAEPEGICDFEGAARSLRDTFEDAENIELLLTQIDEVAALRTNGAQSEKVFAARALIDRQALIHGIRRWFEQIGQKHSSSYRCFAENVLQSGDSVITFNYDLSLDQGLKRAGLWAVGDGYGFDVEGLPRSSKVKLFKLHGSINWRALLFGGRRSGVVDLGHSLGNRPVFCDSDLRTLGYDHEIDSQFPRGRGVAMVDSLILPVREKRFFFQTSLGDEWGSFWDSLWNASAEALRASDRIVVCGYSVLPIDERACKMLLEDPSVTAPFEVCCGNDSEGIVERLRSFGRNAHVSEHTFFGEWVTAQAARNRNCSLLPKR